MGANELTEKYKHITHDGKVIIAVRREREKSESEIGLHEIVSFFENKMLKPKTVKRIKKINNLRNSFHLRKDGVDTCTVEDVEESLALLNLALTHALRFVK